MGWWVVLGLASSGLPGIDASKVLFLIRYVCYGIQLSDRDHPIEGHSIVSSVLSFVIIFFIVFFFILSLKLSKTWDSYCGSIFTARLSSLSSNSLFPRKECRYLCFWDSQWMCLYLIILISLKGDARCIEVLSRYCMR